VISRQTSMKRVILVRIAPQEDILLGLRQAVADHQIKNGLILTGFGSVSHSHFHVVMSNELPPKESYPKSIQPLDICSFNGYILDGKVYCHIDFFDERNGFGGHLEEGTLALTFANIAIGEIEDSVSIVGWDSIAAEADL
jgi:predicted DNA-binding protein with PD1-like motif